MAEAFSQLDALTSLSDDDKPARPPPTKKKIDADTSNLPDDAKSKEASFEQEMEVYKDMVGELEQNEEAEAYADIMSELGGSMKQTDDTYSQVMSELGGTPKPQGKKELEKTAAEPLTTLNVDDSDSTVDTEKFMDSALEEALKEVKVHNPKMDSSVLDDEEIMKEIEDIFNQGNEKLLASLDEIRREQVRAVDWK